MCGPAGVIIDTDRPMDNIPTEGSPAGDALAAMLVIAPFFAVLIGSLIRPPLLAFFLAILGGLTVVVVGARYALSVAPGSGTMTGVYFFGAAAGVLSLLMAGLTSGSRALLKHQKDNETLVPPANI